MTHFPGAVQILDLLPRGRPLGRVLRPAAGFDAREAPAAVTTLLYNGEPLQLIVEMKGVVAKLTDADAGWKHINYFQNNPAAHGLWSLPSLRLADRQRLGGGPVQVRGGRRFKGNGMRWRPHDNECVLRTRLAVLNGELDRYFQPVRRSGTRRLIMSTPSAGFGIATRRAEPAVRRLLGLRNDADVRQWGLPSSG